MSSYEDKKQARIDRYNALSGKASAESTTLHNQAHKMGEAIPFGQPILVGHHSERRDRNYREKMWNKMGKAVEASNKAAHYAAKAEAAENNTAISSDDPEALTKLKEKLAGLQGFQSYAKRYNAYYRKHGTCKGFEDVSDEAAAKLDAEIASAYSWCKAPFASFTLQNNNANIRRVKERIATLEKKEEVGFVGWEFPGGKVEANIEENRLQVFFDGKPDEETRSKLKGQGFHWSNYHKAWQRQLNANAIYAASRLTFLRPASGVEPYKLQPRREAKNQDGPVR